MRKEENFFRLIKLVYTSCEVIGKVYESKLGGTALRNFLQANKHTLFHLHQNRTTCCSGMCSCSPNRILNEQQLNHLFDMSSQVQGHFQYRGRTLTQTCSCITAKNVDISDLDITLLSCLMINCCSLSPIERTYLDDIRKQRNELLHCHKLSIGKTDYSLRWTKIESTLNALSTQLGSTYQQKLKEEIAAIKHDPVDKSVCMTMLEDIRTGNEHLHKEIKKSFTIWIMMIIAVLVVFLAVILHFEKPVTHEEKQSFIGPELKMLIDKTRQIIDYHRHDEIYIRTDAVNVTFNKLKTHNLAIVRGKPRSGKSTLALQVASEYQDIGTPSIIFNQYEDFSRLINCSNDQLAIVEDVFGKSKPRIIEDLHSRFLERIRVCIQDKKTKVLITTRPLSEKFLESSVNTYMYIDPFEIVVDIDKGHQLSAPEKKAILKSYMKFYHISSFPTTKTFLKSFNFFRGGMHCELTSKQIKIANEMFFEAVSSTETSMGFPFLCLQFCLQKRFRALGLSFFKNPQEAMLVDIDNIRKHGKTDKYVALQYSVLVFTALKKELNIHAIDRALFQLIFKATYSINYIDFSDQDIKDAAEDNTEYYLQFSEDKNMYLFQQEAIREIVAFAFGKLSRTSQRLLVSSCDWNTLMNFAKPLSYNAANTEYIINIHHELYFELLWRFTNEWYKIEIKNLISHIIPINRESTLEMLIHCLMYDYGTQTINTCEKIIKQFYQNEHTGIEKYVRSKVINEMSESTFLSMDEHGNSFIHYWMLETFTNKSKLFDYIWANYSELLEVVNSDGHTPIHFALYTGRFDIIKDLKSFYKWFSSFSRDCALNYQINDIISCVRYLAVSNLYTLMKMASGTCFEGLSPIIYVIKRKLENSATIIGSIRCLLDVVNGRKLIKPREVNVNSVEWKQLRIKVQAKIIHFDEYKGQDVEDIIFFLVTSFHAEKRKFDNYFNLFQGIYKM